MRAPPAGTPLLAPWKKHPAGTPKHAGTPCGHPLRAPPIAKIAFFHGRGQNMRAPPKNRAGAHSLQLPATPFARMISLAGCGQVGTNKR